MTLDNLITVALIAGGVAVLLVMAWRQDNRAQRDAKRRNKEDGSIVIQPFQQAHPVEKPATRQPRGRINDKDRPSNLKGW